MKRYLLVPKAVRDLDEILDFIATDSLDASLRVKQRFEEVFQFLGENPQAEKNREDLTHRQLRFFPVFSYLVVYLSDTDPIEITRVLSATRNVKRILA